MRYVTWGNGTVHIKKDETPGRTVCGRNYRQLDFYSLAEEELDLTHRHLCHKCSGERREGPRTIREALVGKPYERKD